MKMMPVVVIKHFAEEDRRKRFQKSLVPKTKNATGIFLDLTSAAFIVSRTEATSTMSVLLETSLGDIVIDLMVDYAPKACEK